MRSPILLYLVAAVIACGGQQPPSSASTQPAAPSAAPTPSSTPATTAAQAPPPASASADPQAPRNAAIAEAAQLGTICTGSDPDCAGSSSGSTPTSHEALKPGIHEGTPTVNGRLPPEVIRRIVRQGEGRARLCYLDARKANAKLAGRITVKFVIDKDGAVSAASDGGSDIGDDKMIACVVRSFGKLTFPKPESGIVTVVYPLTFAPD